MSTMSNGKFDHASGGSARRRVVSHRAIAGRFILQAASVLLVCGAIGVATSVSEQVAADDAYERPPISYSTAAAANRVTRLQARLDSGELSLKHAAPWGYLGDVLKALEVPVDSQTLVFSKTSLQLARISPRTPRAIYFNDDIYIGYCQNGDVLEVSAVDPALGTVFYTLDQDPEQPVRFERRADNCLVCHSSSRTDGVPGHLVRSLYVDRTGTPILSAGSRTVDHTTPFEQRWGGWYVTGTHGEQKHLGNLLIDGRRVVEPVDNAAGQNVESLDGRFATDAYLSPHSDLVALLVLEHQTLVHNRITKASFEARQSLAYDAMMNKALDRPEGTRSETSIRRIASASEQLVEALLMVDEAKLAGPVRGSSDFATRYSRQGPRDDQGRSLRELDLRTRLFKFPCSPLIYSTAFDSLPKDTKALVGKRLGEVLSAAGNDASAGNDAANRNDGSNVFVGNARQGAQGTAVGKFGHLSTDDRRAIRAILLQTKPGLLPR